MRILQFVILRLVCLGFLAGCAAVTWFGLSGTYWLVAPELPDNTYLRCTLGVVGVLLALIALFPWRKKRRQMKTISFAGVHGNVVIQLDSVENTINRAVGKLPEVKKVSVTVVPTEDARKVRVTADVTLNKAAGAGARETGDRVSEYISETTRRILGSDEVMAIDLNVRGILVDTKTPKPAPAPAPEPAAVEEEKPVATATAPEPEEDEPAETIPLLDPQDVEEEEDTLDESDSPLPEIDMEEQDEPEDDDAIGLELEDDSKEDSEGESDEKPSSGASLW